MMKKRILLLLLLSFAANFSTAQQRTVEKRVEVDDDYSVQLDLKFGETITVKAWNKNEVLFRADININNGKLNDALEINFGERDRRLEIVSDYDHEKLKSGRREDCPEAYSKYSWNNDDDGSYVVCSNINYTLFVPANINLQVESISGDIELEGLVGPIRAKSISGFVDLSWPDGKPANVNIKTISGEAFTDIETLTFSKKKKDHIPLVGYKIKGSIGNGGPAVSLESISGNIYLRQGKEI